MSLPQETKTQISHRPLKLHDRLIENVNSWGNVEYNIPLRTTKFETRTSTNVAHRFIPNIPDPYVHKITQPLPERVTGRDQVVEKETYRTTSSTYDIKPNPNKVTERADCAMNCQRTIYMPGVEKRLQKKIIVQPIWLSEMKDKYQGLQKSPQAPPDIFIKNPVEEFTSVSYTKSDAPAIPESEPGYRKLLDPYFTTYRKYHRQFSPEEQTGTKDQITYYSMSNYPKSLGFGPKYKEIWEPLLSKPYRPVYDKVLLKKEYKEAAAAHNTINSIKGRYSSEYQKKFRHPYTVGSHLTAEPEVKFDLGLYPPNLYQTTCPPYMYCSDYCHISQGTSPLNVIDLPGKCAGLPPHKPCAVESS